MSSRPIRYRRIRVHKNDDDAKLYSLIHDYLKDPELAKSVEEISIRRPAPRAMYFGKTEKPGNAEAKEAAREVSAEPALIRAVQALGFGERTDAWLRALTFMKPEVVETWAEAAEDWQCGSFYRRQRDIFANHAAAMLLTLCPNIERLTLQDDLYTTTTLGEVLFRNNHGLLPEKYLQNLKHVKLIPTDEMIIGDERFHITMDYIGMVRLFHRSPSLESISVDGISEDGRGWDRCVTPPHISNVKKLHIGRADFSSHILQSIIRLPKSLEEFSFSIGGRATNGGGTSLMNPETIGKALLCHKSSLRSLDLDVDDYIRSALGYESDEDVDDVDYLRDEWFRLDEAESTGPLFVDELPITRDYGYTIGSLHDFTAMKQLRIGVKLLLGPGPGTAPFRLCDGLPPNLESLHIRGYKKGESEEYDQQLNELLDCLAKYSALQDVRGIAEMIPNAETVYDPDNNVEKLWKPEEEDDGWLEE